MFAGIKNNYHKSLAAVVVQNLLEMQVKVRLTEFSPQKVANRLVEDVWGSQTHLFDGRFGQRPFKVSVAASALAFAIANDTDDEMSSIFAICLINILQEMSVTRIPQVTS